MPICDWWGKKNTTVSHHRQFEMEQFKESLLESSWEYKNDGDRAESWQTSASPQMNM